MPIGLLTLEIHIPDAHSLKDKRQVLRSLKDRLRARFNVAVAELDRQDTWQRSLVGVVSLSNDAGSSGAILASRVRRVRTAAGPRLDRPRTGNASEAAVDGAIRTHDGRGTSARTRRRRDSAGNRHHAGRRTEGPAPGRFGHGHRSARDARIEAGARLRQRDGHRGRADRDTQGTCTRRPDLSATN